MASTLSGYIRSISCNASILRPHMATFAPFLISHSAVFLPIPEEAPVTIQRLFSKYFLLDDPEPNPAANADAIFIVRTGNLFK